MGRLQGKTAIVTGGSSGIGAGIAERFLEEGASVIVADRRPLEGGLADRSGESLAFHETDVTVPADLSGLFEFAAERFGSLDVLVNNAGASTNDGTILDVDADDWDKGSSLLLRAPMLGVQLAAPLMTSGGSIINISSAAALRTGAAGPRTYSIAKAALLKLTTVAALDLAGAGIRVNSILPGFVFTPIMNEALGATPEVIEEYRDEIEAILRQAQPLAIAGAPDNIARAALFLASDESAFVTGAELIVDGGLTLLPSLFEDTLQRFGELAQRIAERTQA